MSLKRLHDLANFLGTWYPDADLDGLSDMEVAHKFKCAATSVELQQVIEQLDELLSSNDIDLREVSEEANRSFRSLSECEDWLRAIRGILHP